MGFRFLDSVVTAEDVVHADFASFGVDSGKSYTAVGEWCTFKASLNNVDIVEDCIFITREVDRKLFRVDMALFAGFPTGSGEISFEFHISINLF